MLDVFDMASQKIVRQKFHALGHNPNAILSALPRVGLQKSYHLYWLATTLERPRIARSGSKDPRVFSGMKFPIHTWVIQAGAPQIRYLEF